MIDFVQKCALPTFIPAKVHLLEKINRPLSSSIICQYQALWTAQELSPLFAFLRNFMTEHNLNPCDKGSGGCQSSQVGVGWVKISIHQCIVIYFFPVQYRLIKSSESIQASSGPWPPAVPRWVPLGPCLLQLEPPRPWPGLRVGGWCTAETPLQLWRQVADVWRTALSETVNSQCSRSHPGCCTVRLQVALSSG